ncbi:hypothetical protein WN990_36965 [Kitasatospora purpeofusca]|uniref:hypothetical protein n=1 Tax=Kitasatospora purpeofusca TaxID=67352 RepID=UPI0030F1CE89
MTEPVVHAEAWEAGATLHTALAQHTARAPFAQDEDDDQEDGLLGDVRSRVRRRAAGMPRDDLQQALHREDERAADRYADAAYAITATVCAVWQRVRDHTVETGAERYDLDTAFSRALHAEQHRQDIADRAGEAAHQDTGTAHRRVAGPAAQPLCTALERAGLHTLTHDQAVRDLTQHLDPTVLRWVLGWLERVRAAGLALRGTGPGRPARRVVRRSW